MRRSYKKSGLNVFLGVCLVVFLILAIDGMITASHAKRDHLVVQTWGGRFTTALVKGYFEPFTEETGIKVVVVEGGADIGGKLAAMQRSNNIEWDMITSHYAHTPYRFYKKGFLEKVDYGIVNNTEDLIEGSLKEWGVATVVSATCLVFNKNAFPDGGPQPKTITDFFDTKKFPGPRMMPNWGAHADNLLIAWLSEGNPRDEFFPIDFDRVFKIMDKIKPHVKIWYKAGAQLVKAMVDEEVVMGIVTDGRAKQAIDNGAPFEIVWDQAFYHIAYNSVVKNTPNYDKVMRLLKYCNKPELQAINFNYLGYCPPNLKAIRYIHPKFQNTLITNPDVIKKMFGFYNIKNSEWNLENIELGDQKWNTWLVK